ncbi:MAG: hypothetical protein SAK29_14020 [Scytonema sp. PMC 1069.18]|nr:hypothetical protein [Scytonema sp. PMC 1069.18]MEC4881908.1 hypothetical protein [Scytonema sp. PMC 1070.18]
MSQNPLVDAGAQFSKPYRLKPALVAALASLEVQLDQELARYRRTRNGYKNLSQPRVGGFIITHPQQPVSAGTTEHQPLVNESVEDNIESQLQNFGLVTATAMPRTLEQEELSVPDTKIHTPPQYVPENQQKVTVSTTEETPQREAMHSASTPVSPKTEAQGESILDDSVKKTTSTSSYVSIIHSGIETDNSHEYIKDTAKTTDDNRTQPEDYLESSEALLRSLTEEEPQDKKPITHSNDSLLSPLGIGSMLLLLLASLTLGYVVFNPNSLANLNFSGLFKKTEPTLAENSGNQTNTPTSVAEPTLTPIPKYPNLATDEFPEVRDPNDVVTLTPKPKQMPTVPPNQVPTQNTTTNSTVLPPEPVLLPESALPTQTPPSVSQKPTTPAKSPTPKQTPNAEIKPSADGFYHVITDNKGNNALASAQRVVSDAYLSNDGTVIYLGALKTKEKAQQLLQQLQAQGINARIE